MQTETKVRKKKRYTCPNPLFVKWLTEWKQEAAEKGLKLQYTYAKALSSLKKYPLPLSSGKEAKILDYFGDKICSMLDAKLAEYQNSSKLPEHAALNSNTISSIIKTSPKKVPAPKKVTSTIQIKTVESTIIKQKTLNLDPPTASPSYKENSVCNHNSFQLLPEQYRIVLCVDNCETLSGHGKTKKQFLSEFQNSGIDFEMRKLHVGDFLWVARDNFDSSNELVLDFVVERKRLDDLAHSIKDGRFREQKFRMKNSGARRPVYLVENCSGAKYLGLPESTLEQAMINTQIIDGFLVKKTSNVKESVNYLSLMTKMLKNKYQHQSVQSGSRDQISKHNSSTNVFLTFKEFNSSSVKNKSLTVKEMFAKHLMQLFGLSVDRAAAIVEQYKTPLLFLKAYDSCSSNDECIRMVSTIKYGLHKKNIGPALSKSLLQYYGPLHLS